MTTAAPGAWSALNARAERALTASSCLVHGPQQAGKATLVERVLRRRGWKVVICTVHDVLADQVRWHDAGGPNSTCVVVRHLEEVDTVATDALTDQLTVLAHRHHLVGTFRASPGSTDLPSRLQGVFDSTLRVPSLAELSIDLRAVLSDVLDVEGSKLEEYVTEDTIRALQDRAMPGNLGQLCRLLERARTCAGESPVRPEDLPADAASSRTARRLAPLERVERDAIASVLQAHDGNKAQAARDLEMPRSTFYRRLDRLGLC